MALAGSRVRGAQIDQSRNTAQSSLSVGGSALANSVSLSDYQGTDLRDYRAQQSGNTAKAVDAWGGEATVLKGAIASVDNAAMALANSVSVNRGDLQGSTRHVLSGNQADTVQAAGGGASANSIWLDDSSTRNSQVSLTNNTARNIDTTAAR